MGRDAQRVGLRVAWTDESGFGGRFVARVVERNGGGHSVASFEDHGSLLEAHRLSPFDVVVLRTTARSDPLNANAVVRLIRAESPSTVVALCSGCSIDGDKG